MKIGSYFDAVLGNNLAVLFNGTREETLAFLALNREHLGINNWTVVPGETLEQMDVDTYVARYSEESF